MENNKTTKLFEQTIVSVDSDTGEITKAENTTVSRVPREPEFVKVYIKDLARLNNLPGWTNPILFCLLRLMNYNNEIILNAYLKDQIAEELGVTRNSINKGISRLTEKNILIKKGRGAYIANPYFFGRGGWNDIRKIRLQLTYDLESGQKEIKSEFGYGIAENSENPENE